LAEPETKRSRLDRLVDDSKQELRQETTKTKPAIKEINPKLVKKIPGRIGEGTFGTCYCATYRNLKVCVKEYKQCSKTAKELSCRKLRAQAYREASIIFDLGDHTGLPMVFGICTKKQAVMLITQFHGGNEQSITIFKATKARLLSRKEWDVIFIGVANTLQHIHSSGYLHCDLKGNNVLLEKRDDGKYNPVIIDFGMINKYV
jgi:serine/threonine protein kinase